MITDRDIAVRAVALGKGPQTPVREVMSPEVMYCFEDDDTDAIARNMADIKVRRLPVVNRDKRLVGIIALGDLAVVEGPRAAGEAVSGISRPGGCTPRPAAPVTETTVRETEAGRRVVTARAAAWNASTANGGHPAEIETFRTYIDGEWRGGPFRPMVREQEPFTGKVWARVPGGFQRRDDAVQAAHAAFPSAMGIDDAQRPGIALYRFADVIAANAERLADLEHAS